VAAFDHLKSITRMANASDIPIVVPPKGNHGLGS
jgi:hypothetical protein